MLVKLTPEIAEQRPVSPVRPNCLITDEMPSDM